MSNGISNAVMIAITEIKGKIDQDKPLEERLAQAMKITKPGHWMCTTEDECFRAAVGAVMIGASPEERDRIEADMAAINFLSAATNPALGGMLDFNKMPPVPENPLVLLKMWGDA